MSRSINRVDQNTVGTLHQEAGPTEHLQIACPNCLTDSPQDADALLQLIPTLHAGVDVTIDLSAIRFVTPLGATLLLLTSRYIHTMTRCVVKLTAMRPEVRAYLERIDLFTVGCSWLKTDQPVESEYRLGRSNASSNVLVLTPIRSGNDVYNATQSVRRISGAWLNNRDYDIGEVVSVISEICGNVFAHSRDVGFVTIQKYARGSMIEIDIAVADLGIGIRRSLTERHGHIAATPGGYIEEALAGTTGRSGLGGGGLRIVRNIITKCSGSLYLRSETGSVMTTGNPIRVEDNLAFFPGTQVNVVFRRRSETGP